MEGKPTHKEILLNHLKKHNSITQLQYLELYGSWRLSAHIFNLIKDGYSFKKQTIKVKTRFGAIVHITKYMLV
jgi:hypothetical protein